MSFVDTVLTAENTFTGEIATGSEDRVQIVCAGDGAEGFAGTTVTLQVRPAQWPATQWVPIGTIVTGDANGQAQFIEVGSNVKVRAGVATGDFSTDVSIYLAV